MVNKSRICREGKHKSKEIVHSQPGRIFAAQVEVLRRMLRIYSFAGKLICLKDLMNVQMPSSQRAHTILLPRETSRPRISYFKMLAAAPTKTIISRNACKNKLNIGPIHSTWSCGFRRLNPDRCKSLPKTREHCDQACAKAAENDYSSFVNVI